MIVLYLWALVSVIMFANFLYCDIQEYLLIKKAHPEIRFKVFMHSKIVTAGIIAILTPCLILIWCYVTLKSKFIKGKGNAN